jgi:hypothetical protein
MNRREVFKNIKFISKKVYKFNYALISDELQAEQLYVDGVSAFIVKNADEINDFEAEGLTKTQILSWFYQGVMKECFELAQTRSSQLLVQGRSEVGFLKLNPTQKAVIYLKEVEQESNKNIASICGIGDSQVLENLYQARQILIEEFRSSRVFQGGVVEHS